MLKNFLSRNKVLIVMTSLFAFVTACDNLEKKGEGEKKDVAYSVEITNPESIKIDLTNENRCVQLNVNVKPISTPIKWETSTNALKIDDSFNACYKDELSANTKIDVEVDAIIVDDKNNEIRSSKNIQVSTKFNVEKDPTFTEPVYSVKINGEKLQINQNIDNKCIDLSATVKPLNTPIVWSSKDAKLEINKSTNKACYNENISKDKAVALTATITDTQNKIDYSDHKDITIIAKKVSSGGDGGGSIDPIEPNLPVTDQTYNGLDFTYNIEENIEGTGNNNSKITVSFSVKNPEKYGNSKFVWSFGDVKDDANKPSQKTDTTANNIGKTVSYTYNTYKNYFITLSVEGKDAKIVKDIEILKKGTTPNPIESLNYNAVKGVKTGEYVFSVESVLNSIANSKVSYVWNVNKVYSLNSDRLEYLFTKHGWNEVVLTAKYTENGGIERTKTIARNIFIEEAGTQEQVGPDANDNKLGSCVTGFNGKNSIGYLASYDVEANEKCLYEKVIIDFNGEKIIEGDRFEKNYAYLFSTLGKKNITITTVKSDSQLCNTSGYTCPESSKIILSYNTNIYKHTKTFKGGRIAEPKLIDPNSIYIAFYIIGQSSVKRFKKVEAISNNQFKIAFPRTFYLYTGSNTDTEYAKYIGHVPGDTNNQTDFGSKSDFLNNNPLVYSPNTGFSDNTGEYFHVPFFMYSSNTKVGKNSNGFFNFSNFAVTDPSVPDVFGTNFSSPVFIRMKNLSFQVPVSQFNSEKHKNIANFVVSCVTSDETIEKPCTSKFIEFEPKDSIAPKEIKIEKNSF